MFDKGACIVQQSYFTQQYFEGFPYMLTHMGGSLFHIAVLPAELGPDNLKQIVRFQVAANKIDSCLVLAPDSCVYFYLGGNEAASPHVPRGGMNFRGLLRLCREFTPTEDLLCRSRLLEKYAVGPESQTRVAATGVNAPAKQAHPLPQGLVLCGVCGDWRGDCINPTTARPTRAYCRCENDTLCARCGRPLYDRRVNANYYDAVEGRMWQVGGFAAIAHKCSPVPEQHVGSQGPLQYSVQEWGSGWILFIDGEGEYHHLARPRKAADLRRTLLDRSLDVAQFVSDLRKRSDPQLGALADEIEAAAAYRGTRTYVDDGDLRIYRHPREPLHSFDVTLHIGDACSNLTFAAPDGCHEIAIDLRAQLGAQMIDVLRVRGQATADGKLQLIVTHGADAQELAVEVSEGNRLPVEEKPPETQRANRLSARNENRVQPAESAANNSTPSFILPPSTPEEDRAMEEMLGIFRELSGVLIPVAPMLPEEPEPQEPTEPPVGEEAEEERAAAIAMEKPTLGRYWNEEDLKARAGWTIHFGPMLRPTSRTQREPQPQLPSQPPEPPVPTRAKRPRRDLKPKVGVTNPVTGEEQVVQAHKQPPVRAKHGRGRVRRK